MANVKSGKFGKWRRRGLVVSLIVCMLGAAYLGGRSVLEWKELRIGEAFYSRLADDVDGGIAAQTKVNLPNGRIETDGRNDQSSLAAGVDRQNAGISELPISEMDFARIRVNCPDAVGWIRLADSEIDYPIVQGDDNDYYLYHLPNGTPNSNGSIMMDCANKGDFSDEVTILHGHHMRSGAMFGRLEQYKNAEYYDGHRTYRLMTPHGDWDVAVFAAYTVNGATFGYPTGFADEAAFDAFLLKARSSSPYESDVEVRYGDRIVMLSTCAYNYSDARYIVLGKVLEDQQEPDER